MKRVTATVTVTVTDNGTVRNWFKAKSLLLQREISCATIMDEDGTSFTANGHVPSPVKNYVKVRGSVQDPIGVKILILGLGVLSSFGTFGTLLRTLYVTGKVLQERIITLPPLVVQSDIL